MSELFRSAMGWVSNAASTTFAANSNNGDGSNSNHAGSVSYSSGAPEDDGIGELISIGRDESPDSPILFQVRLKKLIAEGT